MFEMEEWLTWEVALAAAAVVVVGAVTLVAALKLYLCVGRGVFDGRGRRVRMEGKTVIVTGASAGIGRQTALELAAKGARVLMACRNLPAAESVRDEIIANTKNENVIVKKLDVSSFASIREFAADVLRTETRLDVLIHNAGTAENKIRKTEDGIEVTMATNHFGPFLLTHLLIDLLKRSAPSRIVIVASELYRLADVDLENLNPSSSLFPPWIYYPSKRCNVLVAHELARRLAGSGVTCNSVHPGLVDTAIWSSAPPPLSWGLKLVARAFFKTPRQGAQTTLYAACAPDLDAVTGKHFADCKEKPLTRAAADEDLARKLWEKTLELVDLKPNDPKI